MEKPLFFFVCAFILVSTLSFSSALTLERDVDDTITFPVTFNGSHAAAGTTCKLSIIYPNQTLMVENVAATYTGSGVAQYTIPDNSIDGPYKVPLSCTFPTGESEDGNANFAITPNGEILSGASASVYVGLIIILLAILVLVLWGVVTSDSFGWKMGLTSFAYIVANIFLLVCWKTAESFLTAVPFLEILFHVLWIISNACYIPMFLGVIAYMLFHMTDEKNIETLMDRGFTEDQARWRTKRK